MKKTFASLLLTAALSAAPLAASAGEPSTPSQKPIAAQNDQDKDKAGDADKDKDADKAKDKAKAKKSKAKKDKAEDKAGDKEKPAEPAK